MKDRIDTALKDAMRARDSRTVATLRMASAALKDREIAARGEGKTLGEEDHLAVLQKMVRQREEAAKLYEDAGRPELAEKERAEIAVLSQYLPQPLSEREIEAAIAEAIAETGASGPKDMGKVIAVLKARYPGRIDFGKASGNVKAMLAG